MEKVTISREDLKTYPKNKPSNKFYHMIIRHKNLSAQSINTTVKLLYQVMTDKKESK